MTIPEVMRYESDENNTYKQIVRQYLEVYLYAVDMNEIQNENQLNSNDSHSIIVNKLHLIYWYSVPETVVDSNDECGGH